MKIDQSHQDEFRRKGIVSLRSFLPAHKTQAIKTHIFEELTRLKLRVAGKWQTKKFDGVSPFQVSNKIGQSLKNYPEYDQLIPKDMTGILCAIASEKLALEQTQPQLLITPPQKEPWTLPTHGWHVDVSTRDRIPGIQIFVLLDKLEAHGGATLAIAGSHLDRNIKPEASELVEMWGNAGDVFVMDMRVLHAPSINSKKNARLMLTCRYLTK